MTGTQRTPAPKQRLATRQTATGLIRQWEDGVAPYDLPEWADDAAQVMRSMQADVQQLAAVRQALAAYHLALDQRQHGGVAAGRALDEIQTAMGRHWTQGVALAAQRAGGAHA